METIVILSIIYILGSLVSKFRHFLKNLSGRITNFMGRLHFLAMSQPSLNFIIFRNHIVSKIIVDKFYIIKLSKPICRYKTVSIMYIPNSQR